LTGVSAIAAPRIPPSDSTVLEHVPAASEMRQLEPLRQAVTTHPQDLTSALRLAQGYLDIGRANADPRFVSYAEATLAPWLARDPADPAALTTGATVLQYLHRFDEALTLLNRALAEQRWNGQAWLTKATILQVQGRFEEARQACLPLIRISGHLVALACLSGVDSLTGSLGASYHALSAVFSDDPRLDRGLRVWILDQLADMAERAADVRSAESYLQRALNASPRDGYSLAAYADLLLQEGRDAEVSQRLRGMESQDNLLLRLAIAGHRHGGEDGQRWSAMYQARREAALRDGDLTHMREQARFLLEVRGDAAAALEMAERNWQVQREPADIRIYYAAAVAARDERAKQRVSAWMRQIKYEDRTIPTDTGASSRLVQQ